MTVRGGGGVIFACGCTLAQKLDYGYTRRVVAGEDRCPEHDEPVQNWRSLRDRDRDRVGRHPVPDEPDPVMP